MQKYEELIIEIVELPECDIITFSSAFDSEDDVINKNDW